MPYVRSSDGVRLHYRESGRRSGPAVLLIQGLGADKHLWDLQRIALAPWFRTIAFDNRGAGRSDPMTGRDRGRLPTTPPQCSITPASTRHTSSVRRWAA